MSVLGGVVQLKSIAIEERPIWRLHWSAFSSQRGCVWQLTRFGGRKWRSGLNRISHPDWVKLSVELNCAPNQNTKFSSSLHMRVSETKDYIATKYSSALEVNVWVCMWGGDFDVHVNFKISKCDKYINFIMAMNVVFFLYVLPFSRLCVRSCQDVSNNGSLAG